jgi:hypothetical protein
MRMLIKRLEPTLKLFDAQFHPDGDGYIYRRSQTGAAFRITGEEQAGFIAAFRRHMSMAIAGVLVASVGLVAGMVSVGKENAPVIGGGALAAMVAFFCLALMFIWNAPVRALAGRKPSEPALTGPMAQRMKWRQITWGQFAVGASGGVFLWFKYAPLPDLMVGWNWLWPVGLAVYLGVIGWRVWQKWRYGRQD